ncbi:hypothetical protein N7478_011811 [Penicillium angulare]|uniref:uncharacterized protein n=1 Tax=Penicillium angulare TaxID=116970 RepID=UPI002540310D|nr:uncharacterized protein N7478_011811 [Penicillium angulare]KAJ5261216.1 hypothetical protein N7478_011811 [Penicillium angulare]
MSRILNTLRHTRLDPTGMHFCVAWPFQGSTTQCFKVEVEDQNAWVRFMADSHDSAAFDYLTMDCFETSEFRCKRTSTDSIFWVKVFKGNKDQGTGLVPLMLVLSERKKQHSRLREIPTGCAQGEAVLNLPAPK